MSYLLRVFYKSGLVLNTRLHPMFFKERNVSLGTRAIDIAHGFAPDPWKIIVSGNGEVKFEKVIRMNDPAPLSSNSMAVPDDVSLQRKQQRLRMVKKAKKHWSDSLNGFGQYAPVGSQ